VTSNSNLTSVCTVPDTNSSQICPHLLDPSTENQMHSLCTELSEWSIYLNISCAVLHQIKVAKISIILSAKKEEDIHH
jgi:hypothetical protein